MILQIANEPGVLGTPSKKMVSTLEGALVKKSNSNNIFQLILFWQFLSEFDCVPEGYIYTGGETARQALNFWKTEKKKPSGGQGFSVRITVLVYALAIY